MRWQKSVVLWTLALVVTLGLPACGQKGPLTLPPPAGAASGPER